MQLKEKLACEDIELKLIYGQPSKNDATKGDSVDIDGGIRIRNRIVRVFGKDLYWQPILSHTRDADLVIVEQANKLLVNYLLLVLSIFTVKKAAFWGHGKNLQSSKPNHFNEWIKSKLTKRAYWFFAYTQSSADIVRSSGYPCERITVIQNAIDTRRLRKFYESITAEDICNFRDDLRLCSDHIGLYAGGMYPEKNLVFLLEACKSIRQRIPDFEMLFIGSGIDAYLVKDYAEQNHWVHYLGPRFDEEKALCFAVADVFLIPGVVGLAILDCFAMELPLITTQRPDHGPEIDYLIHGFNGVMVSAACDPEKYAEVVCDLLVDGERMSTLVNGCKYSAELYTVEQMVDRFTAGVINALK